MYTYNAPHAACAYAGYLKGYKTILEASADPEIAALQDEVLKEAIPGLKQGVWHTRRGNLGFLFFTWNKRKNG